MISSRFGVKLGLLASAGMVALGLVSCAASTSPTPSPTRPLAHVAEGMVGKYPIEIPQDSGPEPYAMGTVEYDADGVPASYHVVAGDLSDYIAERFGFFDPENADAYNSGLDYLNTINQVRRGGYPWTLYAGDTLNLSAFTITSVGSIDGVVKASPPPDPMPPQR